MSTRFIAGTLMSAVLLAVVLMFALKGCQDSNNAPDDTAQDSTISEPEKTAQEPSNPNEAVEYSSENITVIQYSNELPKTGGVKVW